MWSAYLQLSKSVWKIVIMLFNCQLNWVRIAERDDSVSQCICGNLSEHVTAVPLAKPDQRPPHMHRGLFVQCDLMSQLAYVILVLQHYSTTCPKAGSGRKHYNSLIKHMQVCVRAGERLHRIPNNKGSNNKAPLCFSCTLSSAKNIFDLVGIYIRFRTSTLAVLSVCIFFTYVFLTFLHAYNFWST